MKKLATICTIIVLFFPAFVNAGGIVTNTNQSASFIRMPALDAIIGIEGVYYNPAGLVHLEDGFHLALNNQYVTQSRVVESSFPMNQQKFEGNVLAPLFPTFYAVYKRDRIAYSFGLNPIGGGGSANFENGLPSFEQQFAVLPGMLTENGINTTQYSMRSAFEGTSLNWGFQFNASYMLNEMVSISLGFRYVSASESYNGYLKDVMINPLHPLNPAGAGNMVSAPAFFTTVSQVATAGANSIQPIIDGGGGGLTIDQLLAMGIIDQEAADMLTGGLGDMYDPSMTVSQIQLAYIKIADTMTGYAQATSDKEVDASRNGFGISPIVGVNIKFSESFSMALKYEHKADITMVNKTVRDDIDLYPDGGRTPNDMPSLLAVGIGYKPIEKLYVTGGFHYYFDKSANYGIQLENEDGDMVFVENKEVIDNNFWEAAIGLEYQVTENIFVSTGYLRTQTGVNEDYHSDLSHSLNTNSIGIGGKYIVNENIGINLGFMTTMYEEYTKDFTAYEETYNRSAMVIALGLDFRF